MIKVYCKNCKHLKDNIVEYREHFEKQKNKNESMYISFARWCEINTFEDDWYTRYESNSKPKIKNKNNDCKDYEKK